ncbi:hypothetical protein [Streptomyces sp. NPDC090036]|uniref:hypothetical protein n=1 Tax=Streptomyces sp. NPDC090036 TaxID=3365926 RepID=UPI00382D49F1
MIYRLKNLEYFSSLAAISSAVSWQLSTSMNNSGIWSWGGGEHDVGLGAALARRTPRAGSRQRDLGRVRGDRADTGRGVDGGLRGRLGLG